MQESVLRLNAPLRERIALVSDLHDRPCGAVLASLEKQRPTLICVTGDFVLGVAPDEGLKLARCKHALALFRGCAGIAPCYVSLGNHEWMLSQEDLALVAGTGAVVLDNRWVRRGELVIGGLSSAYVTHYRAFLAECGPTGQRYPAHPGGPRFGSGFDPDAAWLTGFAAQPGYKLLLCHHPEYWARFVRPLPIELTLSGHAHGGQIRLFGQGLFAPGQGVFPRYTSGLYEDRLAVSRGLSNTTVIPRLFNPTQLITLELSPEE